MKILTLFLFLMNCYYADSQQIDFRSIVNNNANYCDSKSSISYVGDLVLNDSTKLKVFNHSYVFTSSGRINHRIWFFDNNGSLGYYMLNCKSDFPIKIINGRTLIFQKGKLINFDFELPKMIIINNSFNFTEWVFPFDKLNQQFFIKN